MKFVVFMIVVGAGFLSLSYGTHLQDPYAYDWNLWQYAGVGFFGGAIIMWQDLDK